MIYLPLYFPSVTFGIVNAEVFPWAFILSLFLVKKVEVSDILLLLGIFLSSIYGIWRVSDTYEVARIIGSYLNFFAAFIIAKQVPLKNLYKIKKINKIIFLSLIFIGFVQYFNLIPFLDFFFKLLIPRGSAVALTEFGGRGVSLLSTEPSRAGVELIFIYVLFRYNLPNNLKLITDIFIFLYLLVVIKSVMALGLYLIFFVLIHLKLSLLIGIIIISLIPYWINIAPTGRISILIYELANSNIEDIFFVIMNSSGHRVFSIWASYYYGFIWPLGGGVGAWKQSSIEAINALGYDVSKLRFFNFWGDGSPLPIRPSGLVSNLMLDLGSIFSAIFVRSILSKIRCILNLKFYDNLPLVVLFIVKIMFVGSVGTTVEIFCFVVLIRILATHK